MQSLRGTGGKIVRRSPARLDWRGSGYNGRERSILRGAAAAPQPGQNGRRQVAYHPRARPGHHQLARDRVRSRAATHAASRSRSSARSSRSRAGSSTTPTRSGRSQSGVMHEALAKAGVAARDVAAIGITNQRETTVAVGPRDRPADRQRHRLAGPPHRADVRRAARRRARRDVRGEDRPGPRRLLLRHQAAWLLDNVPGARARAARGELAFGTVDAG